MLGPLGMQAEIERIPINRIYARFSPDQISAARLVRLGTERAQLWAQ